MGTNEEGKHICKPHQLWGQQQTQTNKDDQNLLCLFIIYLNVFQGELHELPFRQVLPLMYFHAQSDSKSNMKMGPLDPGPLGSGNDGHVPAWRLWREEEPPTHSFLVLLITPSSPPSSTQVWILRHDFSTHPTRELHCTVPLSSFSYLLIFVISTLTKSTV